MQTKPPLPESSAFDIVESSVVSRAALSTQNVTGHAGGASDPTIINRRDRRLACTRWFAASVDYR
jgi:hypothetical protein